MTPLDQLCTEPFHTLSAPLRAGVLGRLANTQIFVALSRESEGERVDVLTFDLAGVRTAICADSEDRLTDFFAGPVAYAAMPGRVLARLLREQGAGLMVNAGAGSEMLLNESMLEWLENALSRAPVAELATAQLHAPSPAMVAALAEPLAGRLADMAGLIRGGSLVGARHADGSDGHLVVITGAAPDVQARIAKAIGEMIAFLPPLPQDCDVAFDLAVPPQALQLHISQVQRSQPATRSAPGSDPDKPPILRF